MAISIIPSDPPEQNLSTENLSPLPVNTPPIHSDLPTIATTELLAKQPRIIYGDSINGSPRIWHAGTSPFSVYYSIPPETSPLHTYFWSALGNSVFAKDILKVSLPTQAAPTILEVHFGDAASCKIACTNPLTVSDHIFLASIAVAPGNNVYRAALSQLPPARYPDLVTGLKQCLAPFGTVREIVVYESYGFFDGTGSVLMDRPDVTDQQVPNTAFQISYNDQTVVLGEWSKIEFHSNQIAQDIDISRERSSETMTCRGCSKTGHLEANCPHVSDSDPQSSTSNKRSRHTYQEPLQDDIVLPRPMKNTPHTGTSNESSSQTMGPLLTTNNNGAEHTKEETLPINVTETVDLQGTGVMHNNSTINNTEQLPVQRVGKYPIYLIEKMIKEDEAIQDAHDKSECRGKCYNLKCRRGRRTVLSKLKNPDYDHQSLLSFAPHIIRDILTEYDEIKRQYLLKR
ncbi:hypothetical protein CLU79DRAFT_835612 [Phycomyces nitens]|nr:hypothetical protein CLU79DRAFT_835612 [Phycomyces nitens]